VSEGLRAFLPYGRHSVDEDDVAAVSAVLRSEWLTTGPAVAAFEEAFAARVETRFAVACSSGTAALHLAALALGLDEDAAVVVPSVTFVATANAARYVGARVVFTDVDATTGLMSEDNLREALDRAGPQVKAVFPVHLNGQCADMEPLAAVAAGYDVRVVEDASHALGADHVAGDGTRNAVGSCRYGDLAVFSLHPVKTIAMGEGGVVTTNDEALHRRLLRLRNHGMVREPQRFENAEAFDARGTLNPWYYEIHELGFNYRASDIHCALGLSQLGKLERFVARRRELAARYDERLARLAPLVRPIGRVSWCDPAWHLYVVRIDFDRAGLSRAALVRHLREKGIGTQVHYFPLHRQPYYRRHVVSPELPGAGAYYEQVLSLPLYPSMEDADVERVVGALESCLAPRGGGNGPIR
jgi:UDP-4-amino-4,6-dideoxy-N-acetyl-beta-L-altrosamine transaminase